jgi:hypothetical protein
MAVSCNLVRLGIYSTNNIDVYSTKGMIDDRAAVIVNISASAHEHISCHAA